MLYNNVTAGVIMSQLQTYINRAVIVSECSHIFCCVLPVMFSLLSLLAGVGLMAGLPAGMIALHDVMHKWEVPMIAASGIIIAIGWGLYTVSLRFDCRNTGCAHGGCDTKKRRSNKALIIATALFAANVSVYSLFHSEHTRIINTELKAGQHDEHSHDHEASLHNH